MTENKKENSGFDPQKKQVEFTSTEENQKQINTPIEKPKFESFNPNIFPCKCGGVFRLGQTNNEKTKHFVCDKCNEQITKHKYLPPKCHTCKLFYKETDADFDGCPWISCNKVEGEECKQAYIKYDALGTIRNVHHRWFKYEDESLLDLCLAVRIHSLQLGLKYVTPLCCLLLV